MGLGQLEHIIGSCEELEKLKEDQSNMIKATIHYYVKATHPDIEYIDNINQLKEYSDTFRVEDLSDHTIDTIKRELALVAGGGYNTQGIVIMYYTIGGEKQ